MNKNPGPPFDRRILLFVVMGLAILVALAFVGTTWAAPGNQGTVPTPRPSPTPVKTIHGPPPRQTSVPTSVPGTPPPPTTTPTATTTPTPIGPFTGVCCLPGIVFNSNRDGNEEIYIMHTDGSGVTRLTNNPAADLHPSGAPNAQFIVFESNRDDPDPQHCGTTGFPSCIFHIYVMNVDGTGVTQLTDGPYADLDPVWSFDSSRIAFDSTRDDPDPTHCGQPNHPNCLTTIYVMNTDGSDITRLTPNSPGTQAIAVPALGANFHPNWAPDDAHIAFVSSRDDPHPDTCGLPGQPPCVTQIYTMKYDGTAVTRLTVDSSQDGHPAWSADGGHIAFHSNRTGHFQIYVMNADGTNILRATNDLGDDVDPNWAPGCNNRIVFASNREGGLYRIWTMDPDGANQTRVTTLPSDSTANDENPDWSGLPTSLRVLPGPCCVPGIAFQSSRTGNFEIYLVKADGSSVTQLTYNAAADLHPAPSFNGQQLAFASNRDDPNVQTCGLLGSPNCLFQIYVMKIDGSNIKPLTSGPGAKENSAWSPDGTHIAFDSTADDPDPLHCGQSGHPACIVNIYVMRADGSEITRLTQSDPTNPVSNMHPHWSPDNRMLAFESNRDGNVEIYSMSVDGSGQTRLTNNPAEDEHPSWSPDGLSIVFDSNRDGHFQIYKMARDGSNQIRLTDDQKDDEHPYWCPSCTDRIAYSSNRDGVNFSVYTMNSDGTAQERVTSQLPGSTAPDDMPAWSGLPVLLPVPIALPPLLSPTPAPVLPTGTPFPTITNTPPAVAAVVSPPPPVTPTQAPAIPTPSGFAAHFFTNSIHGPSDLFSASPATLLTNGGLAVVLALLFGVFGLLIYDTFEAHEKDLQRWLGPLNHVLRAGDIGRDRLLQVFSGLGVGWVADLVEIGLALLIFGLVYSFLDPSFSLSNPDLVPLILGLALSVGLVNLLDDIAKLIYLRRVGARAVVRVHNANFVIAALMVLISRGASLQPGILAVGPGGLEGEEKGDPFLLNLFGTLGYGIPAIVAWLLLIPFSPKGAEGTSLWLATVLSMIFAIGLQMALFEMIPIPGFYGQVIFHKSRVVWFVMLAVFGFLFMQTQLNPDGEFLGAFNKSNVIWLTIFTLVFCLFSAGFWYYFQRRASPGGEASEKRPD
jgi:Tol biopolymer transport system component